MAARGDASDSMEGGVRAALVGGRKAARSTLASAHLAITPAAATKELASAAQTKPVRLVWEPRAVPLSPALLATPKPTSLRPQAPPRSVHRAYKMAAGRSSSEAVSLARSSIIDHPDPVGAGAGQPDVLTKAATSSTIATSATVPALAKIVDIASALSTARLGSQRVAWAAPPAGPSGASW
ncbi:hypothetical protein EMIHUDRAFT_201677 [Emiliania huxleyi CCMP1516]|uniref:Uncharacterized protein n=2 Tax=Emiliania huxleyi TaxID=2903 RepID=A0A0D3KIE7_EMIH1|nr:hypothetical protein EMIHUDRAFT_201677 [Emiliania huxleyi CCMP1516]EOD35532.1 hypothetical protein EMIHUDRAFT_201677 [Emiliania huxleyi CCMP1516]|eukprot:XP_005787961.1 hypothetical protein EMIHUDRAFT_201677 [Emiliania huxleyi CCMP1516]